MEKLKLLTISDLAVNTGFSRVMTEIIRHFPEHFEVSSLAINYFGDPHELKAKLYPASAGGDLYGINRLGNLIDKINPDRILILQDSWIIKEYLKVIKEDMLDKVVIYTPVDAGPYMNSWLEKFPSVKRVCAYTEFGKEVLLAANPDIKDIAVIPHGINTDMFYQMDQNSAREKLGKLEDDLFIILNVNRNQPRKKIDICAKAFGIFAQDKPDVRYYHHAGVEDAGWNIVELAKRYGFERRLILSHRDLSPQKAVSDESLNNIYNAADVGLNLSSGEGWGLCFAGGTEVLTTLGFKKIENVKPNDSVFDSNGQTTLVKNTLERDFDGEIYKLRISGLADDVFVTAEHPFLTSTGFVETKDLTLESFILKPDLSEFDSFKEVDLTHYAPFVHDNRYIYFIEKRKKIGSKVTKKELPAIRKLFNANVRLSAVRKINRYIKLDRDMLSIMYYFLSTKTKTKHFSYSEELSGVFTRLFDYNGVRGADGIIKIDANLTLALARIATKQATYLALSRYFIMEILDRAVAELTYMHPTSGSLFFSSQTDWKTRVYRIILLRLGIAASEFSIKDGTVYISIDKKHLSKYLHGKSNRNRIEELDGFYYKVNAIEKVAYTGKVYNLETESHTYNVYGYAVHNCNMEHSVTGKPQILSANSANLELYSEERGLLVPINHYETNPGILTEGGVVSLKFSVEAMEYAYNNREEIKKIGANARDYFLQDKFKWSNISNTFREIIENG